MIDLGERKKTGSSRFVNTAPAEADVGNTKSRFGVVGYCLEHQGHHSYKRGSTFNAILLRRIIFPTAEKVCLRKNAVSLHSPYTQGMTLAKIACGSGWLVGG